MNIRLIFSDVDDTVVPAFGDISERTRKAISACEKKAIPFVICSGRWLGSAMDVVHSAGIRSGYAIIANGSYILRPDGTPVHEWFIPEPQARSAAALLAGYPVSVNIYSRNRAVRMKTHLIGEPVRSRLEWQFRNRNGAECIYDDDDAFESCLTAAHKLEVYGSDAGLLCEVRDKLESLGLAVSSSHPTNLEIVAPGMGKGTAVRWLAEHLSVRREETMAFGDNVNDLDMLAEVGWPVAVENAVEDVRRIAKIIAPACSDDGVAQIIESILEDHK